MASSPLSATTRQKRQHTSTSSSTACQRRYLSCLVALPPSPFLLYLPTCVCAAQVVVQWHPSLVVMVVVATPSPPPPPPPPPPQTAVLFAHLCATCTPDVRMLFLPSVDSIPLHQHQQQPQLFPLIVGREKSEVKSKGFKPSAAKGDITVVAVVVAGIIRNERCKVKKREGKKERDELQRCVTHWTDQFPLPVVVVVGVGRRN